MRIKVAHFLLITCFIFTVINQLSCRKQGQLTSGGVLTFSDDTLKFDTVFTAAGSFTTGVLIYNRQSEAITVSSVRLNRGAASYFHLNVDGFKGNNVTNLKIAPNDSIYVFATVNIDPTNALTPFIVTDSLIATLNGKEFYVPFTAYGQNARYITDSILTGNITWDTLLPYVIVKSAQVNPGATLNINPGCRIYMHQNSGLIVLGKLVSNGTLQDSVIFQGDRLDRSYFGYRGYAGEWGGLYFASISNGSRLSYTRLINGGNAALGGYPATIWVEPDSVNFNSPTATPQLSMNHCTVENSIGYGILSRTGSIVANNCLVHTAGAQAMLIFEGGFDSLTNCTFANYGNYAVTHINSPVLGVLNWRQISQYEYTYADLNAVFRNCLVYGSLDSELVCDTSGTPAGMGIDARLLFDHCLLKIGVVNEPFMQMTSCINKDPQFVDYAKGNFHIKSSSPAKGAGHPSIFPFDDLDGKPRIGSDIGCYNYTP
ncbi:MAG: hypothetical protein H7257_14880 [Taibaiella sp.]|nr:hypothetical protein [Taibaiella sp.]